MSEIYRILNELDIDMDELEVSVTDMEKQYAKRAVREHVGTQIGKKKLNQVMMSLAAVIAIFFVFGLSFPAIASQIPIFGGIFSQFETIEFEGLDELAAPIEDSHSMNGLKVTIESAVFDGRNLVISWSLSFDEYVGFNEFMNFSHQVSGDFDVSSHVGGWMVERINEREFIGWTQYELLFREIQTAAEVDFNVLGFGRMLSDESSVFQSWEHTFNLELMSLEGEHVVLTDIEHTNQNGIEIDIHRLEQTPALTRLFIDVVTLDSELREWESMNIAWGIEDDLGNEIVNFLGSITSIGAELAHLTLDFFDLNLDATQLTLTPTVEFNYYTDSEERLDDGITPRYWFGNVGETLELSPIIINLP